MTRTDGHTKTGRIARCGRPAVLLACAAAAWMLSTATADDEIIVGKPIAAVATSRPATTRPAGDEVLIGRPIGSPGAGAGGEEILIGRPVAAPTTRPAGPSAPKGPPAKPPKPRPKRPRPPKPLAGGEELLIGAPVATTPPGTALPGEELLVGTPTTRPVVIVPGASRGGPGIGTAIDPYAVGTGRLPGAIVPPRYRKPPAKPGQWRPGGKHTASEAAGRPFWRVGRDNDLFGSRPIDVDADDADALIDEPVEAPDYFKSASMRDGFEAIATTALPPSQWKLDSDDVFSRRFTANDRPGVSFVWPAPGYGKRIGGEVTGAAGERQGSFWVTPRINGEYYTRYFDSKGAALQHWVGLEIPPEDVATAAETYQWRLKQPVITPPGWGAVPTVLQHRKGDEVMNILAYRMPTGTLPKGTTNVELRLYHKPSGRYMAMNQHDVTIDGP